MRRDGGRRAKMKIEEVWEREANGIQYITMYATFLAKFNHHSAHPVMHGQNHAIANSIMFTKL